VNVSTSDQRNGSVPRFDAYYELLGIPPAEQPPSYYRLLGLSPLESNLKVIERATDRQMNHLRSFKTGEAAIASQQLLNEVARASRVLLNPGEKALYDRSLQPAAPVASSMASIPATSHQPQVSLGLPAAPQPLPRFDLSSQGTRTLHSAAGTPSAESSWPLLPLVATGVAVCLAVLVLVVVIVSNRSTVADNAESGLKKAHAEVQTAVASPPPPPPLPPTPTKMTNATASGGGTNETGATPPSEQSQQATSAVGAAGRDGSGTTKPTKDVRQLPVGEWVDLLAMISPQEDVLAGNWQFDGKELSGGGQGMSKVKLPADLRRTSYDLQVEFTSDRDPGNVNIILPVGDRSVLLVGDGYINVGTYSYFSLIQGKEPMHFPGSVKGPMLFAGERYRYDIAVRIDGDRAKLTLALNDEPKFSYEGPIDDLQVVPVYRLPDDGWPGLATWFSSITYLGCKVRVHEGDGKLTRGPRSPNDAG
jgi:hypothetical protein